MGRSASGDRRRCERQEDAPIPKAGGGCETEARERDSPSPPVEHPSAPLKEYHQEPEERPPEGDFCVVAYEYDEFYVTREVAERVLRELGALRPPRWIRFTDVHGSAVSVRSQKIDHVREWTVAQRESARAFRRARRREEKADRRPWEDED